MTREEILEKVNEYCTERQYTSTLTDAFKDKFADHFLKANPEGDIADEALLGAMKFALNTAFSSASEIASLKATELTSKENELKTQIAQLEAKIKAQKDDKKDFKLPQEIKDKLDELETFKIDAVKRDKYGKIIELAKGEIRKDLHSTFEKFAKNFEVSLEKGEDEQSANLVKRFQDIMMDSIGDIKPLAPHVDEKRDEDFLASLPKVKVQ